MFSPEILANNIKKYRVQLGYTQQELAKRLYVSGQAISKWESAQSMPDLSNLTALSELFMVSVDELIGNVNQRQKLFLGIDGGATKTEFVLIGEDGQVLQRLLLEGCNPNACGMDTACQVLKNGMDTVLARGYKLDGVFAGIAGTMSGDNRAKIQTYLQQQYPFLPVTCDSDIANVVSSAGEFENCVAMICGTGSVIYANVNGKRYRIGGWGYLLDTVSGGFTLGKEALRAVLAQQEGTGPATVLTELVTAKLGKDVWASIADIYQGGDSLIASFAPLVLEAYGQNDAVAAGILQNYADETAKLLNFTLETYDCDGVIVASGGLMHPLAPMIRERIPKGAKLIVPETPAVYGACRRACKLYGTLNDDFEKNFTDSYQQKGAL